VTAEEVPEDRSDDLWASLARPLPEGFTRSVVTVDVGGSLSCASAAWRDALVLVASGAIDVESPDGTRFQFCTGAVLALADLAHSRLRNSGTEAASLVTIRRSEAASHPSVEPPV
jgi:hypothetical protein